MDANTSTDPEIGTAEVCNGGDIALSHSMPLAIVMARRRRFPSYLTTTATAPAVLALGHSKENCWAGKMVDGLAGQASGLWVGVLAQGQWLTYPCTAGRLGGKIPRLIRTWRWTNGWNLPGTREGSSGPAAGSGRPHSVRPPSLDDWTLSMTPSLDWQVFSGMERETDAAGCEWSCEAEYRPGRKLLYLVLDCTYLCRARSHRSTACWHLRGERLSFPHDAWMQQHNATCGPRQLRSCVPSHVREVVLGRTSTQMPISWDVNHVTSRSLVCSAQAFGLAVLPV